MEQNTHLLIRPRVGELDSAIIRGNIRERVQDVRQRSRVDVRRLWRREEQVSADPIATTEVIRTEVVPRVDSPARR